MNIGNQISTIRKEQQLTQEQFGALISCDDKQFQTGKNEKKQNNGR